MFEAIKTFPYFKLLLIILILFILGMLYFDTFFKIAIICWSDDDYSHGLFLPLISVFLIYSSRDELLGLLVDRSSQKLRLPPLVSLLAFFLTISGSVLFIFGKLSGLLFGEWLSFYPLMLGLLLFIFGPRLTKFFFLPLVLNFMAKPLPDSLFPKLFGPLQSLSAHVGAKVLELLNVPVYVLGNVIEIPRMQLLVEEACSGIRSLIAIITVAIIVIQFIRPGVLSSLLLLVLSIVVAILLNVFRVAATGVLAHFYDPKAAEGFFHTFSGFIFFGIALVFLYTAGTLLVKMQRRNDELETDIMGK